MIFPDTILINGNSFVKQEMLPAHNHVLYVCIETHQQVKARYLSIMEKFELEGSDRPGQFYPYILYADTLLDPIRMKSTLIPAYYPAKDGTTDIGAFIEAMKPIGERIKARKQTD